MVDIMSPSCLLHGKSTWFRKRAKQTKTIGPTIWILPFLIPVMLIFSESLTDRRATTIKWFLLMLSLSSFTSKTWINPVFRKGSVACAFSSVDVRVFAEWQCFSLCMRFDRNYVNIAVTYTRMYMCFGLLWVQHIKVIFAYVILEYNLTIWGRYVVSMLWIYIYINSILWRLFPGSSVNRPFKWH